MYSERQHERQTIMGRITSHVRIRSLFSEADVITCDAWVDTGAAYMVLPAA
jgi:hypothetical protein